MILDHHPDRWADAAPTVEVIIPAPTRRPPMLVTWVRRFVIPAVGLAFRAGFVAGLVLRPIVAAARFGYRLGRDQAEALLSLRSDPRGGPPTTPAPHAFPPARDE